MTARQFALPLDHRPAHGRADFLVGDCNRAAVALIDRWPDWPGPVAAIFGPPGCGKSHLADVWAAASGARMLDIGALDPDTLADTIGDTPAVVIDDVDNLAGPAAEQALFHLINLTRQESRYLLLTARQSPARLSPALPDLASRLRAVPAVEIRPPDDDLLGGLMVKLFADRQLTVSPELVGYLLNRIDRSFEDVRRTVSLLDERALARKRPITIPLARELLGEID